MANSAYLKPDEEKHIYHIEALVVDFPSVTTCLDLLDKSGPLMGWAVKTMFLYLVEHQEELKTGDPMEVFYKAKSRYKEVGKEAMDTGSEVHNLIEVYLKGQPHAGLINERTEKPFGAFLEWQKQYKFKLYKAEHIIWSELNKYAGTLDLSCYLDGKLYIVDLKASKAIYDTYLMQVAAYKKAFEEQEGLAVSGIGILRLDKETGIPEFKEYTLAECELAFEKFMCLCRLWHLINGNKKKNNGKTN